MEVIVDGDRNVVLDGHPTNAIATVVAANTYLKEQGRAILSVKADGREVAAEELAGLGEVNVLEITSENVAELVQRSFDELDQVLPELPKVCHSLAAVFQGDAPSEGYEPFEKLAEIWGAVKSQELLIAGVLGCSLEDMRVDGMPVLRMHEELNRYLEEAADAIRTGDCVLLGDLLEYELAPRAEQEGQIVAALRRHVQPPTA